MNTQTLRAVVNCLVPADDFPGAYEAGVCDYLQTLFATDLRHEAEFFTAGLNNIDLEARTRFAKPFASLPPEQQTITLEAIQQRDQRFFEMLVCTTAEGFYSNPISWTMTGFEDQA
jgi:gluconate 2-dehydrogenase subunit 3-like protein